MEKISKSQAKDLYFLNETDLENLNFTTKNNFYNSNNDIKLYNKEEVINVAINKYGNMKNIENKVIKKKIVIDEKKKKKEYRKEKLLNYFNKNSPELLEDDILSEYPCYLFIEYNEKKFLKEIKFEFEYSIANIYSIAYNRIKRREKIFQIANFKNINIMVENSYYNQYINDKLSLESCLNYIEEENYFNKNTLFKTILNKHNELNLSTEDVNNIKDDCLYYLLITIDAPPKFPELIKDRINKIINIIMFIKENSDINLEDTEDISYYNFIRNINKRRLIIKNILKNTKTDIPSVITNDFSQVNQINYNSI